MLLSLIILYVITLIYLSIVERFRNYASIIAFQGWILLGIALLRLHSLDWVELSFVILETLIFKALIVPAILMRVIRKTKINRVSKSGSTHFNALMLSGAALAASAVTTYYVADQSVHMIFFGVALYALLSGLILIVLRSRIFTHMVGFLVIENGVFLFSMAIGVEMPILINTAILLDILIGVLSLAVGALFLRRTNNYKRFLSYSTVENMGIAAIGLGVGGIGAWAAILHVACHTLIKSSLFLQMAVVRQIYNGYRINRIGDYININRIGAIGMIVGMVAVLAFPPSPLFVSELMILSQTLADGAWWLAAVIVLLLCIVIYSICYRIIKLCYQPNQDELHLSKIDSRLSYSALTLLAAALVAGFWQPEPLRRIIDLIANM